jgi:hypothetical protein
VFREFFEAQYKRKPTGKLSAADLLPQLPVFADAGRVPSRGEVRRAVKKLNLSGPGYTGNTAAAWKALLVNESVFAYNTSTPPASSSTVRLPPTGNASC